MLHGSLRYVRRRPPAASTRERALSSTAHAGNLGAVDRLFRERESPLRLE